MKLNQSVNADCCHAARDNNPVTLFVDVVVEPSSSEMSQVLSVTVGADLAGEELNRFLALWNSVGSSFPADNGFDLTSDSDGKAVVTIDGGEIVFQGQFGDREFSVIDAFAGSLGVDLLHEGEPLDDGEEASRWESMGLLGKSICISGGILLLPVAIALLPVLLVVGIIRLVFTLFVAERRAS